VRADVDSATLHPVHPFPSAQRVKIRPRAAHRNLNAPHVQGIAGVGRHRSVTADLPTATEGQSTAAWCEMIPVGLKCVFVDIRYGLAGGVHKLVCPTGPHHRAQPTRTRQVSLTGRSDDRNLRGAYAVLIETRRIAKFEAMAKT
jgi:hypothetical protein